MDVNKLLFRVHNDVRGNLVAIEEEKDIPFQIKRIYYIYNVMEGAVRGLHAHKSLKQLLICIHGNCKVLLDDGKEKITVELDNPNLGLYISNAIWREMSDFSSDAVLLVLASEHYDENDYIRDYKEFLQFVKESEDK